MFAMRALKNEIVFAELNSFNVQFNLSNMKD